MRSAGLKNITAKHLGQYHFQSSFPKRDSTPADRHLLIRSALASQSLSVMIALIPYIRETLRRHLNQKQAVMLVEFDKLKRVRPPSRPSIACFPPDHLTNPSLPLPLCLLNAPRRTTKSTRTRFTRSWSPSWETASPST